MGNGGVDSSYDPWQFNWGQQILNGESFCLSWSRKGKVQKKKPSKSKKPKSKKAGKKPNKKPGKSTQKKSNKKKNNKKKPSKNKPIAPPTPVCPTFGELMDSWEGKID